MSTKINRLIKDLEDAGWRVQPTKAGWMFYPPDKSKSPVATHGTPSDSRAVKNLTADLRRSGFTGKIRL